MDRRMQALPDSPSEQALPEPSGWVSLLPKFMLRPLYHPKVFQVLEPCPAYHQASVKAWYLAMYDGPLGRELKEAIAVAVSAANQCPY